MWNGNISLNWDQENVETNKVIPKEEFYSSRQLQKQKVQEK